MRTLFAFGDSYTYGHGLEDCWMKQGNDYTVGSVCSQYAWPSLLAKDLEYNMVNRSAPGFSNLAILHRILNTNFDNDSLCVVMWSIHSRDMIFHEKYNPTLEFFSKKIDHADMAVHVGSWAHDGLSKDWMLAHNDTDLIMRTWLHVHHANLYLSSINVPHYNFFVDYDSLRDYKPKYVKIPYKDIKLIVGNFVDYALDNCHPGPLTHEQIAKDIKECLVESSLI